jgi:hypothetical protein
LVIPGNISAIHGPMNVKKEVIHFRLCVCGNLVYTILRIWPNSLISNSTVHNLGRCYWAKKFIFTDFTEINAAVTILTQCCIVMPACIVLLLQFYRNYFIDLYCCFVYYYPCNYRVCHTGQGSSSKNSVHTCLPRPGVHG